MSIHAVLKIAAAFALGWFAYRALWLRVRYRFWRGYVKSHDYFGVMLPLDIKVICRFLRVAIDTHQFSFGRDVRAIGRFLRNSYRGVY